LGEGDHRGGVGGGGGRVNDSACFKMVGSWRNSWLRYVQDRAAATGARGVGRGS